MCVCVVSAERARRPSAQCSLFELGSRPLFFTKIITNYRFLYRGIFASLTFGLRHHGFRFAETRSKRYLSYVSKFLHLYRATRVIISFQRNLYQPVAAVVIVHRVSFLYSYNIFFRKKVNFMYTRNVRYIYIYLHTHTFIIIAECFLKHSRVVVNHNLLSTRNIA